MMSNINENRIDAVLLTDDVTAITTAATTIIAKLPANTALSSDQRKHYKAIDVSNKVFCENALTEAQISGTGIISAYVSLPALKNDLDLYNQMLAAESQLQNVLQRMQDVRRICGHEALKAASIIYGDYSRAASAGVDNAQSAYTALKTRYEAQSSGRPLTQNE